MPQKNPERFNIQGFNDTLFELILDLTFDSYPVKVLTIFL